MQGLTKKINYIVFFFFGRKYGHMLATHDNHAITCVRGHVWVWFVTSLDVSNSLVPNLTTNACNLGWVSTIIWFIEVDVFSIWCQNAHGTYDVGMYFFIKLIIKREGRRRRGKKKRKKSSIGQFFFSLSVKQAIMVGGMCCPFAIPTIIK